MKTDPVLVIAPDGTNLGTHSFREAEKIAEEKYGLDLVEVRPGVYKILNVGKLQYEASKRKAPKVKPTKEMKFKLNIGDSDFNIKVNHIKRFLKDGSVVKVTIWFSGREVSRPEVGITLMQRIAADLDGFGVSTINESLQGKNMTMSISPTGKK